MELSGVNLYNQFQNLRAQLDALNESTEPRKLPPHNLSAVFGLLKFFYSR